MTGRFPDERHQYDMKFTIGFGAAARELRAKMGSIEYRALLTLMTMMSARSQKHTISPILL